MRIAVILALTACGASSELATSASDFIVGEWEPLGGELVTKPGASVSAPALALGGDALALSESGTTRVLGWSGTAWSQLGDALSGDTPALASGNARAKTYVCRIDGAHVQVSHWLGGAWVDVGAPVDIATGVATAFRYYATTCSLAVTGAGPVVAWSAHFGSKFDLAFAATWHKTGWKLLGTVDGIGNDRATDARLVVDGKGTAIVATFEPGGSYGGGATTRVYAFRNDEWTQIGDDMIETSWPTIAAGSNFVVLAVVEGDYPHETDRVRVYRSNGRGAWHELPGALSQHGDDVPALAVTASDEPVVAFAREPGLAAYVRSPGGWTAIGAPIEGAGGYVTGTALAIDPDGAPTLAWIEQTYGEYMSASVRAQRFTAPLP